LKRRQEELEKRAQELERREAELRNNPQNGKFIISREINLNSQLFSSYQCVKNKSGFYNWPISKQNLEF
jgi:hypothetical protein